MDPLIIDILLEFLEVAFHNVLYYANLYPKQIFENRKKFGAPVKYSMHPKVNDYITNCLLAVKELLILGSLDKVVLVIMDETKKPIQRFVFDIDQNSLTSDTDPYLINLEQKMRAFFLKLANTKSFVVSAPENSNFSILMHTTESGVCSLAKNSEMEHFPLIEIESMKIDLTDGVIPVNTLNLNGLSIQTYIEH